MFLISTVVGRQINTGVTMHQEDVTSLYA